MDRMDKKLIEKGVRLILEGVGEDPDSQRLEKTPQRAAEMFAEVLSGTDQDPEEFTKLLTEEKHDEMVVLW